MQQSAPTRRGRTRRIDRAAANFELGCVLFVPCLMQLVNFQHLMTLDSVDVARFFVLICVLSFVSLLCGKCMWCFSFLSRCHKWCVCARCVCLDCHEEGLKPLWCCVS